LVGVGIERGQAAGEERVGLRRLRALELYGSGYCGIEGLGRGTSALRGQGEA
jgi:hypothetical protein